VADLYVLGTVYILQVTELIIGACFKVQTGDIEEAPAWDALPCFKTSIEGDDVSVEINNLGIPPLFIR
jgi:hypothetical protein